MRGRLVILVVVSAAVAACSSSHPAASVSPTSSTSTATTPTTASSSPLKPGPYGFLVPRTWRFEPLTSDEGPESFARWLAPDGRGEIDYEVSAGKTRVVYTRDGRPNIRGALTAVGCTVINSTVLAENRARFECARTTSGLSVYGAIVIERFHPGWRALRVAVPSARRDLAAGILVGLR